RAGEGVEQARLARVRVPGDGDPGHPVAGAGLALGLAGDGELRQLTAELGDLRANAATIGLELGLTGAAQPHAAVRAGAAAGLAAHGLTPAAQTRQEVLQLRELDLGLALGALGVLREDVEDQRRAVDDLDVDGLLQGDQLAGRELAVADHRVGAERLDDVLELADLAGADEGARVGPNAALDEAVDDLGPGGLGQRGELGHGVLGLLGGALGPDADQDDLLEAQTPVLGVGDVGEFGGGDARDASQRLAG